MVAIDFDADDAFGGQALAIELTYRRMTGGLSHLSRRDRAAIVKAARARRQGAMLALQEKRAAARRARRAARDWRLPPAP